MTVAVVASEAFIEQYKRLPTSIQRKAQKQEALFRANPFYPSLHTEKLAPKSKDRWSFRVDRQDRHRADRVDVRAHRHEGDAIGRELDAHRILDRGA